MEFAFFLTDASFHHKTKVSSIGIQNMLTKETYNYIETAIDPTDAETKGIQKALEVAYKNKFENIVIICDNKNSVNEMKLKFENEESLKNKFWYVQFLWVPREFTHFVDYLSKNIPEHMESELRKKKKESIESLKKNESNKYAKKYVNEIRVSKATFHSALEDRLHQMHTLLKGINLNLVSDTFKGIKIGNLPTAKVIDGMIDEMELIEKDTETLEEHDPVLGLIAKLIIDSAILS